jgi:hypothetical protein
LFQIEETIKALDLLSPAPPPSRGEIKEKERKGNVVIKILRKQLGNRRWLATLFMNPYRVVDP